MRSSLVGYQLQHGASVARFTCGLPAPAWNKCCDVHLRPPAPTCSRRCEFSCGLPVLLGFTRVITIKFTVSRCCLGTATARSKLNSWLGLRTTIVQGWAISQGTQTNHDGPLLDGSARWGHEHETHELSINSALSRGRPDPLRDNPRAAPRIEGESTIQA